VFQNRDGDGDWRMGLAAPGVVGAVLPAWGRVPPAILAFHVLCAVLVFRHWPRVRPLFRWERSTARWTVGRSLGIVSFLRCAALR